MFSQAHLVDTGSRRTRSLALSVFLHLALLVVVVAGSDWLADSARRVVRISGQDYDRENYEVTELILPPELAPPPSETPVPAPEILPPDAVLVPLPEVPPPPPEPEPARPEAQAAPPPPPPPEPEPEPAPPPPIIGRDDVIAEGARPDASPDATDDNRGETPPRITLDEPASSREGGDGGEDGDGGDSLEDGGDAPGTVEASEGAAESEASPESPEEALSGGLLLPNLRDRARELAAESEERSRREAALGRRAGTSGSGADAMPDFSTEAPTILSDTRGYDFGPYMNQVVNRVRVNWYSLIPEAARLRQVRGRVVIIFTITKNGNVEDARIVANSNYQSLDNAAIGAIMASNPFPRIPDDFVGDNLVLQFTFLYNME